MNISLFGNIRLKMNRLLGDLLLSYSLALKSVFLTNRLLQDHWVGDHYSLRWFKKET